MSRIKLLTLTLVACALPTLATADQLTMIIQQDLQTLGYDPGNTDGDMTTQTVVAISKFQAENALAVSGEPTPQLAGVIKAAISKRSSPATAGVSSVRPAAASPGREAASQAAQQACLQERIAAAQAANQKKRGLGSLMRAATRTAARFGAGSDTARAISETSRQIYDANATAADLASAARDLGLTEDEIEKCRNPG